MAHALPPPPGHRRRQLLTLLAGVVVAVAVISGILVWVTRSAHSRQTAATPPGGASSGSSAQPSTTPSATTTAPATTSPATTTPATTAPATTPPAKTTLATAPKPTPAPTAVPLIVANNTGIAGLADAASARFASKGWTVSALTNYDGGILSTCAYFDPANPAAQAAALVLQKQFPSIQRVLPRFDGLPSGPIVVVLTDSID